MSESTTVPLSNVEPWRLAARYPSGIAKMMAMVIATMLSSIVAGRRGEVTIIDRTGLEKTANGYYGFAEAEMLAKGALDAALRRRLGIRSHVGLQHCHWPAQKGGLAGQ